MGAASRNRTGQVSSSSGFAKGPPWKGLKDLDSSSSRPPPTKKSPNHYLGPDLDHSSSLSPPASTISFDDDLDSALPADRRHSTSSSEDSIAPEIVVWTETMNDMSLDSPARSPSPATPAPAISPAPAPTPAPDTTLAIPPRDGVPEPTLGASLQSSLSVVSDQLSDLSSAPPSLSSKATTPIDVDSSKELPPRQQAARPDRQSANAPRRRYNVRPKVSIPPDLPNAEYAMQCIAAAESSRLNPYALHQEEYLMLQDHISHAQVTTYLNIRNGILRLWVRNPQIAVTREEAVGCAKDTRWFDVASVCFEWLVRRGYINFGCVEIRSSRKQASISASPENAKQKTVVVIGAGMAGLGCARQLQGLFLQYAKRFREQRQEPPRVVVLEARNRVGGRVYSRPFTSRPDQIPDSFQGKRFTAEMGGMIITGFERGNPMNILVRGQLGLAYRPLRPDTTLYDSNGKPVDLWRDQLVEKLYNDSLDRVSEYKFKQPSFKLIEGNKELMDEGKDSSSEAHKTIRQAEESTAAQPHALPVSEQNIAPQVNRVPVSSDRATGRVHTEPGEPGAQKAAYKANAMGWTLKQGVSDDDDLDIETIAKEPNATLGSVTNNVIAQYKDIVDLNAQDFRLMNWHIANLEYSNAINYNQLSLQGWDIDAGNEWEGSHTMVVGGYQSVPRGLVQIPTPLDVRQKSPVRKITYTSESANGPATVECEDGYKVEADYVVNTIPLGVLKHGSVKFEPPLPSWKSDAIGRLGFGVLNKVIMVYKEPFWDEERDIFGVLRNPPNRHSLDQKDYASQRGRFFQWFNITKTSGLPALLALMAGDAGYDTEQTCNDDLIAEATEILRNVYGPKVPEPIEVVVTRWASDKFARGSYSSAGPEMKEDDYDTMAKTIGNLFFAGEHTSGTHPATVHGAYLTGLRAASEVLDTMLGPIEVPTPLIIPKDGNTSSLKRKSVGSKDPKQARLETYEIELWDHIISKIGLRPIKPQKTAAGAYIFFSKAHYEDARKKCALGRRPGKGKPSGNEVRVMTSKMWKDTPTEARKPYEQQAEEHRRVYHKAMADFVVEAGEWDLKATELKAAYPSMPGAEEEEGKGVEEGQGWGGGGGGG
ncbi:flavin-containing amine oxidoreductase-domain containing protein [Bombardia bombarda]|uniref:Flavin-containing amine oxidoreductase-domain containing protein n=1 Tax=Bombardia bombarda TaxID=252184 RepID=A0AA39WM54_9PEZI|nr:flavin-containing amine oxidoreductase-domain containing protein [Bombardia bombarda]